ncbi:MAG: GNAT family N-acetyltransferase [Methanolobus sp.]|nr:GNAT family N-acetyltransferase [Methanolobus sp.]
MLSKDCLHLVQNFYCNSLDEPDYEKLNQFLKEKALNYNLANLSRTTVFCDEAVCVAYYSLSMNAINGQKIDVEDKYRLLKSYPAIFLTRFAVDKHYQKTGIGRAIINDIIYKAHRNESVAARFLFIDANPKSVSWYLGNPLFTILYSDLTNRMEQCIESQIIDELNLRLLNGCGVKCDLGDNNQPSSTKKNCEKLLKAHVDEIYNCILSKVTLLNECNSKIQLTFDGTIPKISLTNFNIRNNHDRIRNWLTKKENVLEFDITIPLYLDMNKHYVALYSK